MNLGFPYITVVNYYLFLILLHSGHGERKNQWGPFKTTMIKSEKCEQPSRPYEKVPSFLFSCDIHNTTKGKNLMAGNLTVVKVEPNPKVISKAFMFEDGKWKTILVINSAGCRGIVMNFFRVALRLGDQPGCIKKGTYLFKDLDFNSLQHKWRPEMQYGLTLWRIEIISKLGTVLCWEYVVLTGPDNK